MNHYEVLGLEVGATVQDVVSGYRKLAIEVHPDKGGDREVFARVQGAYEVLVDDEKKKAYDEELKRKKLDLDNCSSEVHRFAGIATAENEMTDGTGWELPCRCGGVFEILEQDIEDTKSEGADSMIVGCTYCSLQIEVTLHTA